MNQLLASLVLVVPLCAIAYEISSGANKIVDALNAIEARLRDRLGKQ